VGVPNFVGVTVRCGPAISMDVV